MLTRPAPAANEDRLPPGLAGVIVSDTHIGDVRGDEGFYHYRQYDATQLARTASLEQVWGLLFDGGLPSAPTELAGLIGEGRLVSPVVLDQLPGIVRAQGAGLDALRTAVSLHAGAIGVQPLVDLSAEQQRRQAIALAAALPTLLAALHRIAVGAPAVPADPARSHAEDFLRMLSGQEPEPEATAALQTYLISTIDHGFNASTFTGRVIASTGADLGGVLTGALAALTGPLHGGAPGRALDMVDELLEHAEGRDPASLAAATDAWVTEKLARGERIMGFGHRVYRTDDPRAVLLREELERLGGSSVEQARVIEQAVVERLAQHRPGRDLRTNVEFYAGVVMDRVGIPRELFTATFAVSRVIGWMAHGLEQASEGTIIRPSAAYVGPQPLPSP